MKPSTSRKPGPLTWKMNKDIEKGQGYFPFIPRQANTKALCNHTIAKAIGDFKKQNKTKNPSNILIILFRYIIAGNLNEGIR